MSEDHLEDLEKQKKEYVMIQQRIASLKDELQKLAVAAERKIGIIQYLEAKSKEKKIEEPTVDVSS